MKIAFLGDIALYGKFCKVNNSKLSEYLSEVKKELSNYDLVIGNLETPLLDKGRKLGSKSAYIYSKVVNVETLQYLGIDIVNLANNHIFDYGKEGYLSTINALDKAGIDWFGTEGKTLRINRSGEKLAFHGYCSYNTNPLGVLSKSNKLGISPLEVNTVLENGLLNHKSGYLNIVSVHSGVEHVNLPSLDDICFARQISDKFPLIYYGHHPHVLQGMETYNESLHAYSLGNFCFDDVFDGRSEKPIVVQTDDNKSSIILAVEVKNSKIENYSYRSIFHLSDRLVIGDRKVDERIRKYCDYLKLDNNSYSNKRSTQIALVTRKRNSNRDLKWLVSRLNIATLQRVAEVYVNKYKYKISFKNYLKDCGYKND